jgi:UDP-N-acetylglucosamine 2-epimerase
VKHQTGRSVNDFLHVFVGTKAQLIKMAPIILELDERQIPYRFISAGQHDATVSKLVEQFGLRTPDMSLRAGQQDIANLKQGLVWLMGLLWKALIWPKQVREEIFGNQGGICLIHGDTATTLISLLLARRAGLSVAHVEAGLRSFNLFNPFPEELIRIIAMRFSNLLFAPSDWASDNLQKMRVRGKIVMSTGNTVVDAVAYAKQLWGESNDSADREGDYAVMSIHRFETIRSRRRLSKIITLAHKIASSHKLKFILHSPTQHYLERFRLITSLEEDRNIGLMPLQPYLSFVVMLSRAAFVVSDGGSIQEETHALGIPCLILRKRTERQDGLGVTAVLSGFDESRINDFLKNFESLRRSPLTRGNGKGPSARIVDELLNWFSAQ